MRPSSEELKTRKTRKSKRSIDVKSDRLVALKRLLSYAINEAEKTGSPFVRYCVTLARDSVIDEMGERGMAIPHECLSRDSSDPAALRHH